jgi:hypothetical protein
LCQQQGNAPAAAPLPAHGTTLIAHLLQDRGAWPLGGFAATTSYLVVLAAQLALAN